MTSTEDTYNPWNPKNKVIPCQDVLLHYICTNASQAKEKGFTLVCEQKQSTTRRLVFWYKRWDFIHYLYNYNIVSFVDIMIFGYDFITLVMKSQPIQKSQSSFLKKPISHFQNRCFDFSFYKIEAQQAGFAPLVNMESTNIKTLEVVPLEVLRQYDVAANQSLQ